MLIRVVGKGQRTLVWEKDISVRLVIWRPGRCETCSARGVTRNQGPGPYAIFLIAAKARCQRLPRPGHIGGRETARNRTYAERPSAISRMTRLGRRGRAGRASQGRARRGERRTRRRAAAPLDLTAAQLGSGSLLGGGWPMLSIWMQTRSVEVDEGRSGRSERQNRSARVRRRSLWLLHFGAAPLPPLSTRPARTIIRRYLCGHFGPVQISP